MKATIKICFVLLILSAAMPASKAQNKFAIGPSTCIGTTMQSINNDPHLDIGWKMGIASHFPVNQVVYLGPELNITSKGYHDLNYSAGWFGPVVESGSQLTLYYMELSLPVKFKLSESYFLQAGIQTGYLVHADFELHDDGYTYYDSEVTNTLDKFEIGLIAGMSWELNNGLGFSLIANVGLTDINQEDNMMVQNENDYPYGGPYYIETDFGKNFIVTGGIHYLFSKNKNTKYVKF